ncbi:MAG: DUF1003 domain-containing protein [Caldilineaceae bacterium]|nr:DUF1003 domain-containing protein [Caldilineaceae bacterium]MCB0139846.1 DUF1003 domain-containing protein [Caldilineaceae bacterium]MCB9149125.1 DUF1003 domain-containing protein [Caldilineaceae bacterium]
MNSSPPRKLHFPQPFNHEHPPVQDVNTVFAEQLGPGQRAADRVANTMGSWKFIIIQSIILTVWILLNVLAWIKHWDPYPFILMNLTLSMQAAYAAPIIMMSQNRQAAKDRIEAHQDFLINQKAEEEIRVIMEHLEAQDQALVQIHAQLVQLQSQFGISEDGAGIDPLRTS